MNRRFDSDLDAADAVAGIPEDELMARQEEIDREARWTAFVAECRQWHHDLGGVWFQLVLDVALGMRGSEANSPHRREEDHAAYGPGRFAWHCQQFSETEGWDGVLVAIARAMREQAQERERLLTQG